MYVFSRCLLFSLLIHITCQLVIYSFSFSQFAFSYVFSKSIQRALPTDHIDIQRASKKMGWTNINPRNHIHGPRKIIKLWAFSSILLSFMDRRFFSFFKKIMFVKKNVLFFFLKNYKFSLTSTSTRTW